MMRTDEGSWLAERFEERSYTRDEWLDQLPTTGALTRFPPDKLAEVLESVGAAIDAIGGSFPVSYTTVALTAARSDHRAILWDAEPCPTVG